MNGKYYIGNLASSFETYGPEKPVTGVSLAVDDENVYLAGDQTGNVWELECPYGTQQMANNILASLKSGTYKGYRAQDAALLPSAELGDGVTVGGLYSVLAYRKVNFSAGHLSEIAAPGDNEPEEEYKRYTSKQESITKRKIAETRSSITKTAEEIREEVKGVDGRVSSLSVTVESITSTVQDHDGRLSTVEQTADGLLASVKGLNGQVSQIEQNVGNIKLSVTGSLGGKASITLSGGGGGGGTVDLSRVRQSFANDPTAILIEAGTITFNSDTLVVNSTNFGVKADGTITAKAGTIGGWTIKPGKIYGGDGSSGVAVMQVPGNGTNVFAAGYGTHDNYGGCAFRVTNEGKMYATAGEIGGWSIGKNGLIYTNGTDTARFYISPFSEAYSNILAAQSRTAKTDDWHSTFSVTKEGKLRATDADISGTVNATSGSFKGKVEATSGSFTGTVNAASGTIGGWNLTSGKLYGGDESSGVAVMQVPGNGTNVFAAGYGTHDNYGGCAFRVTNEGKLYATDAEITGKVTATSGSFKGTLTATSGTIGGWSIGSSGIHHYENSAGNVVSSAADATKMIMVRPIQSDKSNGVIYIGSRSSTSDSWKYPFRVNGDGSCAATDITISGSSEVNGVKISGTNNMSGTISGGTFSGGTVSGGTLSGNTTNTGNTITGGTFSSGTVSGGTLSSKTGGTYVGTCSGSTLSSCTLGGSSLTTGNDGGSFYTRNSQTHVDGNSVQIKSSGTGYLGVVSSGAVILGGLTITGNMECSGSKSRSMRTEHFGTRQLDAFETPLPTFSDYGVATLDESGAAQIVIDPVFAETVDKDYLPTVFLTKYGEGDVYVASVEHDAVTVKGTPGMKFAWETRYVQANAGTDRLRAMDFNYMDMSGDRQFDVDADIAYEHSKDNVDYPLAAYEYFTEFERSLAT